MSNITQLIHAAVGGDPTARHALFEQVYGELKRIAKRQLAGHAPATLGATGLVHETYLKLAQADHFSARDRAHFFAVAARAMRQIAIDRARSRAAEKRGGRELQFVPLEDATGVAGAMDEDALIRLDEALGELEANSPQLKELVELRYFAGLTIPEIAELRSVSASTVDRDWRRARAYLYASMQQDLDA